MGSVCRRASAGDSGNGTSPACGRGRSAAARRPAGGPHRGRRTGPGRDLLPAGGWRGVDGRRARQRARARAVPVRRAGRRPLGAHRGADHAVLLPGHGTGDPGRDVGARARDLLGLGRHRRGGVQPGRDLAGRRVPVAAADRDGTVAAGRERRRVHGPVLHVRRVPDLPGRAAGAGRLRRTVGDPVLPRRHDVTGLPRHGGRPALGRLGARDQPGRSRRLHAGRGPA